MNMIPLVICISVIIYFAVSGSHNLWIQVLLLPGTSHGLPVIFFGEAYCVREKVKASLPPTSLGPHHLQATFSASPSTCNLHQDLGDPVFPPHGLDGNLPSTSRQSPLTPRRQSATPSRQRRDWVLTHTPTLPTSSSSCWPPASWPGEGSGVLLRLEPAHTTSDHSHLFHVPWLFSFPFWKMSLE